MGRRAIDLAGETFGLLTAERLVRLPDGHPVWECRCACGGIKNAAASNLLSDKVRSCGCLPGGRKGPGEPVPLTEVKERIGRRTEIVPLQRTGEHRGGRRVNRKPVPVEATPGTWTGRLVRDWDRRDYAAVVTGLGDGEDEGD